MLPEEVTNLIGKAEEVIILEVEKGAIRRFANAVEDPNPIYHDEEYARNSRYGSIIAPPGFFGWPTRGEVRAGRESDAVREAVAKAGYGRILDAAVEYEFFNPIRAGDILVASAITKDIVEREGRSGKMVFVITEATYTNQNGDVVAKVRGTQIHPEGHPQG